MKIIKKTAMNYTIVYIEDGGKYSAYKRFGADEWIDITRNKAISDKRLLQDLEAAFLESEK